MNKLLIFSLSLFIFLVIKPMGDPEETQKATKLEEFQLFQQLPAEIQNQEILQRRFLYNTVENDPLGVAVENIRSAASVNEKWHSIVDAETNKLVDMIINKNRGLIKKEQVFKNMQLVTEENKKDIQALLLSVLGKKSSWLKETNENKVLILMRFLDKPNSHSKTELLSIFYLMPIVLKSLDEKRSLNDYYFKSILVNFLKYSNTVYPEQLKKALSQIKDLPLIKEIRDNSSEINSYFN